MIVKIKKHSVSVLPLLYLFLFFSINVCSATLEKRIDSLLLKMSTQDKIDQLINNGFMTTPNNNILKIPGFTMNDGPHGVRQPDHGTAFPTGIAIAATWDKSIAYKCGAAMGEEFWAFGRHQQLGPCIDLTQDPRAGRNAESGGEDPFLCGQIGAYITRGIQTTPVIATVKHFMIEGKQSNRNERNEIFTDRWASEHYGYNFRTVVQEGAVMSTMVSYNLINGVQASESEYLLDTLLRQRWGFPFYVVSDWGAVHENRSEQAITAGTDLCMGNDAYKWELPGNVPDSIINKAVKNVLRTKILAGMLDYYPPGNMNTANSPEHRRISLEAARKSVILLKNSNKILPLKKDIKVALIGPNANKANLNCFGSSETDPVDPVSLKTALETKLGASNVLYTYGCDINSSDQSDFEAAKNLARQADFVIFAGGLDETQEGEAYGIGNDRANNSSVLPGKQQDLIIGLASENPNLIVVIQSGGVCSVNRSLTDIKGLIYSFYAGHDAGTAIADVIFGDYNPAGRMPVTMPVDDSQLPEWNDDFTDDFGCGYRWFDEKEITPEFCFGFGLSYSTFAYSNLRISALSTPAGSPVIISVDVQNTGTIDGEEVVQLYLSNISSSLWMPKKELKGFERISIAAGEKKTVSFLLTADEFYYWDESDKVYNVNPGDYIIRIGGSSDNLPLSDTVALTPSSGKPDLRITEVFTMPRYPKKGDLVYFYALVKNSGNYALSSSDIFNISFRVKDSVVALAENIAVILKSGNVQLIGSTGTYKVASESFDLEATVDASLQIDEWIENNNSYFKKVGIQGPKPDLSNVNIAINKTLSSSSNKDGNSPENLVDGNKNSRWESAWEDSQWVCVDLGSITSISKIILAWEAAYATGYSVQVSEDSTNWNNIFSTDNGNGETDTITFEAKDARYVKIIFNKRFTEYGFSLYELEIYPAPVKINRNKNKELNRTAAKIHFLSNGHLFINSGSLIIEKLIVCDLQGRSVLKHNQSFRGKTSINIKNLKDGLYIVNYTGSGTSYRQKLLLRK